MTYPSPPDLCAIILRLRAARPSHVSNHMGRAVYSLGLNLLGLADANLAVAVHGPRAAEQNRSSDAKPFTASGLMQRERILLGTVQPGDPAWVRFTGLNAAVAAALAALLAAPPDVVEIDRLPWRVEAIVWDRSANLPAQFSYQQLIDRHRHSLPHGQTGLRFLTATAFKSNGVNLPLPLPAQVFGSLLTRWMAFTHLRLRDLPDDQVDAFLAHYLLLSRHAIETACYRFKAGGMEVGFQGEAQFEIARRSPHLSKHAPELAAKIEAEWVWFARLAELLADYAFYAGAGKKTTSGMGQVRPG